LSFKAFKETKAAVDSLSTLFNGELPDDLKKFLKKNVISKEIEDNMAYTKKTISNQNYDLNEPKLNDAFKAIKGKNNFGNVITHRDSEWSKKLEDATGQDDPDAYLKFIGNSASSGNEEAKRELLDLLKKAGPMPKADFDELSKDYGLDDNQKMAFIKLFKVRN
jgi:hypothetical protein